MIIQHEGKTYDIPEDVLNKYLVKKVFDQVFNPAIDTDNRNGWDWLDKVSSGGRICYHPGRDYNRGTGNQDLGDPVFCVADGKVVYLKKEGGWGLHMYIEHTNFNHPKFGLIPKFFTHYAHLNEAKVKVGDQVEGGKQIGKVGNSGTTWAHLHLEVQKDETSWGWTFYPWGKSKDWVKANYYSPDEFLNL